MEANKVFEDPRGVNTVFCYTNSAIDLDSIITINGTPARISKVYTSAEGWNPGPGSSNQGVIGFNYLGSAYSFGDTFVIESSAGNTTISGYNISYGYLNFAAESQPFYVGNYLYKNDGYFNPGTGDFTIECFFKVESELTQTATFFNLSNNTYGNDPSMLWLISYQGDLQFAGQGSPTSFGCDPIIRDRWHHFAVVRKNNEFIGYLDGIPGRKLSDSTNFTAKTSSFIGGYNIYGLYGLNEVYCLSGAMTNIRITESAVYNSYTFTPPALPLTAEPNTTLLLLPLTEQTKYQNSIDSESYLNHDNPITNQAVTYSAGPINYLGPYVPTIPNDYTLYYTPDYVNIGYILNNYGSYTQVSLADFQDVNTNNVTHLRLNTLSFIWGLSNYPNLQEISNYNSYNFGGFTNIDISKNYLLNYFSYPNARLLYLDVSNNYNLINLDVRGNYLTDLDVSALSALSTLHAENNSLSAVNINKQNTPNLVFLYVNNNNLSAIDVVNLSQLGEIIVSNNNLTSLNLSGVGVNQSYLQISAGYNSLTGLDFISNSVLTLEIYHNNISSFDFSLSVYSGIQYLDISYNPITSIDLSNKAVLGNFACVGASLTAVNINNNTGLLGYIVLQDNNLSQSAVDTFLTQLCATVYYNNKTNGTLYIDGTGNSAPGASGNTAITALQSKGWTVNHN